MSILMHVTKRLVHPECRGKHLQPDSGCNVPGSLQKFKPHERGMFLTAFLEKGIQDQREYVRVVGG